MRKTPTRIGKDIKRATRKHHSSDEMVRSLLDGLRGEDSMAKPCRSIIENAPHIEANQMSQTLIQVRPQMVPKNLDGGHGNTISAAFFGESLAVKNYFRSMSLADTLTNRDHTSHS